MFKYTRASINNLVNDCKLYAKIFKYISLISTFGLLIYQIVTGFINKNNLVYVYVGLLSAFVIFTILDFVFGHLEKKRPRQIAKRIYKIIKATLKGVTLGFTIYEISVASKVDGIQIILATLMIVMWVVSLLTDIIVEVVQIRAAEIMVALQEDIDDIKRPVTTVTSTIKKIFGREVEEKPIDSEKQRILSKLRRRMEKNVKEDK